MMGRAPATPETRSVRLLKVGEQVRHVISDLLTRQMVHDEVLTAHSVSVTEVRMSPDLRHAVVFVKPLLGAEVMLQGFSDETPGAMPGSHQPAAPRVVLLVQDNQR